MNRNILFIDPQGTYSARVNAGLGYIASSLKKDKNINFKVLDLNNFRESYDKILRGAADSRSVDGIGVSLNIGSMYAVPDLLKKIKMYYPHSKVFIGGAHATLFYKTLLKQFAQFIDFAVIREIEDTISSIIEKIDDNRGLSTISGVVLKENLDKEAQGVFISNLDDIDFPAYEYFESIKQADCTMQYYPIVTSRGCPYSCTFCAGPKISGKKWRYRSPENVVNEIETALNKYKTNEIEFFDDHFPLNRERAIAIMEIILEKNIKIRFRFGNGIRADKLDEELVSIMKRAGLFEISMGIETADPETFLSIKKGETLGKIENTIKLLKKFEIAIGGSFIIGLPGATLEKDMMSIKFANRYGFNWRQTGWSYYTPYPGTEAYDMIKNEVDDEKLKKSYQRGNFTSQFIETKDYSLDERIIARSIASKIPPVHPDYSKWRLFKLFLKMELVALKHRDKNLKFIKFNLVMIERILIFLKLLLSKEVHKEAYY